MDRRPVAFAKRHSGRAARGLWHYLVYVATREKFIQAVLTGAIFAVINKLTLNISLGLRGLFGFGTQPLSLLLMVAVAAIALWADAHTDEWREIIANVSGQEEAVDAAEQADEEESGDGNE